jgi:ankyrin repeat protein
VVTHVDDADNDGETALQLAQRREKQEVVDMLTQRGITA